MNLASFLLCLVFAAVGYVVHPIVLPQLVEAGVVSEAALGDKGLNPDDLNSEETADSESGSDEQATLPAPAKPSVTIEKPRIIDEPVGSEPLKGEIDPLVDPQPNSNSVPANQAPEVSNKMPEVIKDVEPTAVTPSVMSDEEIVLAMKESVKNQEVTEFIYENVVKWESAGKKEIDGKEYQIGSVLYKENTIFGEHTLKAEALFQDGKVLRWLWSITNETME